MHSTEKETIDAIKSRACCATFLDKPLNKNACCVFHEEKTPSMLVKQDHVYCFGCKTHADIIKLRQHINGESFLEAVRALGDLHGVDTSVFNKNGKSIRDMLRDSARPNTYHNPKAQNKTTTPTGTKRVGLQDVYERFISNFTSDSLGARYVNSRAIPYPLAVKYGVGYAEPGQWEWLFARAYEQIKGKRINPEPWKWGRVVFPMHNKEGELVSLSSRAIGKGSLFKGKYARIKQQHLPGVKGFFNYQASNTHICESPFDALSLLSIGKNACAVYGSSFSWDDFDDVTLAFDSDLYDRKFFIDQMTKGIFLSKKFKSLSFDDYAGRKDLNECAIDKVGLFGL